MTTQLAQTPHHAEQRRRAERIGKKSKGQVCETCGRINQDSIVLGSKDGRASRFCSIECVISSEKGERTRHWRALVRERDDIKHKLEEERGSKVITLIHREELRGGKEQYITIDNSEEILNQIRSTPGNMPIDFIVHCPGGVVLPCEQIALALKAHRAKVSAIVPHYAMSGATLICLAANEIIMDAHSVLGPLDPQIAGFPSPSLLRLAELKPPQFISDQMLILVDIAEKSLGQMKSFIINLLEGRVSEEKARSISEFLTGGYLNHDAPITGKELLSLGLNVRVGVQDRVHDFMRLHKSVATSPLLGSLQQERGHERQRQRATFERTGIHLPARNKPNGLGRTD